MKSGTKTLFTLFQKLDYRDKENSAKKKLKGILIAYIFANTVLSYNYFNSFDERSFVILAFTSNLFLLALIVLTDFENLFLASRSIDVLRTLPVESSSLFKAKFSSAIIFLLFFILTSAVPQVIFFYIIDHSLLRTFAFIASNIMFSYFAVGVLILIYIFALKYLKEKATLLLNVLQVIFFVFIFYSSTMSSRIASQQKMFFVKENILNYGMVKYLPQTFFSGAVYDVFIFLICFAMTSAVFIMLYFLISKNYFFLTDRVKELNTKRNFSKPKFNLHSIKNFSDRFVLKNNYETASFYLVKNYIQNSKFLRVKYIPIIFMPLLFVLIGLISDAPHLLFFNKNSPSGSFFKTAIVLISPSVTFTLLMCSRLLVSNTKILDENTTNTEWIYDSLPVLKKEFVISGANKFIYSAFIFPLTVLIFVLLSLKTDLLTVALNILFISSGIYLINSVTLVFDKQYPFTLESTKFNSASKFLEILFSMILGVILFLIQIFVFQNIIFVIISSAVFIIISVLLNRN